jgi:hypothetical protein
VRRENHSPIRYDCKNAPDNMNFFEVTKAVNNPDKCFTGKNTHKNQNAGAKVHEGLDGILIERIGDRVRERIVTVLALPGWSSCQFPRKAHNRGHIIGNADVGTAIANELELPEKKYRRNISAILIK